MIGIDPGPITSHVVQLDYFGRVVAFTSFANTEFREAFGSIYPHLYTTAYIEQVASYGMPAGAELFDTCFWAGRFTERLESEYQLSVHLAKRKTIVAHLCGDARAKDANVRQAMIDRFGPPGTKKNPGQTYGISKDVWQALAVAAYGFDIEAKKGGTL